DEERNKLADRFGVLVFFPNAVRIGAAPPLAKNDDVSGSVLVDKNLMRHIAFKATHVRPHFTRETESLFFRTGLEPGFPNDCDHLLPPFLHIPRLIASIRTATYARLRNTTFSFCVMVGAEKM